MNGSFLPFHHSTKRWDVPQKICYLLPYSLFLRISLFLPHLPHLSHLMFLIEIKVEIDMEVEVEMKQCDVKSKKGAKPPLKKVLIEHTHTHNYLRLTYLFNLLWRVYFESIYSYVYSLLYIKIGFTCLFVLSDINLRCHS